MDSGKIKSSRHLCPLMPVTGSLLRVCATDCLEATMYRIYRPADSNTTYAIRLCTDGAHIFDSSTGKRTFVDGDFETMHVALGISTTEDGDKPWVPGVNTGDF